MLRKAADPPCPKCGCCLCPPLPEGLGRALRWGVRYVEGQPVADEPPAAAAAPARCCDHCGAIFRPAQRPPADAEQVVFRLLRCPFCNGTKHHVTRTMPGDSGVRYHQCDAPGCGLTFKSVAV